MRIRHLVMSSFLFDKLNRSNLGIYIVLTQLIITYLFKVLAQRLGKTLILVHVYTLMYVGHECEIINMHILVSGKEMIMIGHNPSLAILSLNLIKHP